MNPEELNTELASLVTELRGLADERRDADSLTREHVTKLNDRISEIETELRKASRPVNGAPVAAGDQWREADDALARYLRKGDARMSAADLATFEKLERAMSIDSQPDGGYVVTPAFSSRIATLLHDTSPMRLIATTETISTDALEGLYDGDDAGAGWAAETEARPETASPELGLWRIPTHELYAKPKATQKLLDDGSIDVAAWLQRKVAESFSRKENAAFVAGNGVGQPRGFTTYPDGTSRGQIERIPSGDVTDLTPEAIVNVVYALKGAYRQGAAFVMNRATVGAVRSLRSEAGGSAGTGQFMWQPGFGGQPATLMGYPIYEFDDMADVGTGGNIVIGFGNFGLAYTIVDRQGVRVLRDPFSAKPYVEFYTTKRVGGDVVLHDAIKLIDIAAS